VSEERPIEDLVDVGLAGPGFVWLDLARCHTDTTVILASLFGFHEIALRDARRLNRAPRAIGFGDHAFLVLHGAELRDGHDDIDLIELDQFVGPGFLVTVHGPLPAGVDPRPAFRDVAAVRASLHAGELRPRSPLELSSALVTALAAHQEEAVSILAGSADQLERRVRSAGPGDIEVLLDDLYTLRNRFLSLRQTAARSLETFERWREITQPPEAVAPAIDDLVAHFARLRSRCDEERESLHALVEFHEARVATKMNVAMERLALISAVLLPITAIASIYGMNVIVSDATRPVHTGLVLAAMALVGLAILRWTKRQGWW
jgi:Mg2+ and Co2+ transporter CorA